MSDSNNGRHYCEELKGAEVRTESIQGVHKPDAEEDPLPLGNRGTSLQYLSTEVGRSLPSATRSGNDRSWPKFKFQVVQAKNDSAH